LCIYGCVVVLNRRRREKRKKRKRKERKINYMNLWWAKPTKTNID
jgi:hypothetical protein